MVQCNLLNLTKIVVEHVQLFSNCTHIFSWLREFAFQNIGLLSKNSLQVQNHNDLFSKNIRNLIQAFVNSLEALFLDFLLEISKCSKKKSKINKTLKMINLLQNSTFYSYITHFLGFKRKLILFSTYFLFENF